MKSTQSVLTTILLGILFAGVFIELPVFLLFLQEINQSTSFLLPVYLGSLLLGGALSSVLIRRKNSLVYISIGLVIVAFSLGMFSLSSTLYRLILFRAVYGFVLAIVISASLMVFASLSTTYRGGLASFLILILVGASSIFFIQRDIHSIFLMLIFTYAFLGFLMLMLKENFTPFLKTPKTLDWTMLKAFSLNYPIQLCYLTSFSFMVILGVISNGLLAEETFLHSLFLMSIGSLIVFFTPLAQLPYQLGSVKSITMGLLLSALSLSFTSLLYYDLLINLPFIVLGAGLTLVFLSVLETFVSHFHYARSTLLFGYFIIILSLGWTTGNAIGYFIGETPLTPYLFGSIFLTLVSIAFIREIQNQHLPPKISR